MLQKGGSLEMFSIGAEGFRMSAYERLGLLEGPPLAASVPSV